MTLFGDSDSILWQLGRNRALKVAILSWAIAQLLKVVLGFFREKRFNFKWFLRSGGMPSSHVSFSMCLAMYVGLSGGFDSLIFAVAMTFTGITMFDAQGVRRHSGRQAALLNRMLDDIYSNKGLQESKLKELFGHTPIEVFAGCALGITVACFFYFKGA